MLNELKKDLFSVKLLIVLLTLAVSIYLFRFVLDFLRDFSDIIWIIILGWLISFIMEPFVEIFTKRLKLPRIFSTMFVFSLAAAFLVISFMIFIPDLIQQFVALQKILPDVINGYPPQVQKGFENFYISLISAPQNLIPSLTQFFISLVTMLILSFYLVIDKENINKKIYAIAPKNYHQQIKLIQKIIDSSFASFVRIQTLWGVIGGVITYIILSIFGVPYAASTSLLAGILSAVPMIGPIIGIIPPILVTILEKPNQAVFILLSIFLIEQFIYNFIGPKLISKAFNVNPIIVILSLLIGIKIGGFLGAILAVPVISIFMVAGQELYVYYFKEKEELPSNN
jgi:predicted PurR-regulated permease PerM